MGWKVGSPYGPDKVEIVTEDGAICIATVRVKRGDTDRATGRHTFVDDTYGVDCARLIAAAPDLLEALRRVFLTHDEGAGRWMQQAYDAIAKAEGR
jgi:hypothetical protein